MKKIKFLKKRKIPPKRYLSLYYNKLVDDDNGVIHTNLSPGGISVDFV